MPRPLTGPECEEFLAEPQVGVVSVAAGDDRPPLTVPTWYSYVPGGAITFFTGTQGRRARKIKLIRVTWLFTSSDTQRWSSLKL